MGCQKDAVLLDPSVSTEKIVPQAAITIDAAKHWFDSTRQQSSRSAVDENTLFLPNAAPHWQQASNDLNEGGQAFVVAPISNDYYRLNGNAKLLIFRDSVQQLQGVFMIYLPDEAYRIQTNGNYNIATFTGIVVYTDVNGQAFLSYKIVNGQIERLYNATINRRGNTVFRNCLEMPFPSCPQVFNWCGNITFCDCSGNCGAGMGGIFGPTGSSPGSAGRGFSYGGSPTTSSGGGSNGGSSGGGGGAWNSSQPTSLFTMSEIESLRIKFRLAGLDDIFYTLELNQSLLRAANLFLDTRGWDNLNKPALENLVNTTGEYQALGEYLTALSVNTDFYNALVASNSFVSTFTTFSKYFKAGFTFEEFKLLYDDQSRFPQIDAFYTSQGFIEENKLAVKGFNALMDYDDDFVVANQNRGNKTIKQLVDDSGFPKISSGFLIGLARKNGVGNADNMTASFTRLGRIMEDFVMRSLSIPKNTSSFTDPTGQGRSYVIPDGLGEGNVARYEADQDGIRRLKSWSSENSVFLDSKFTARQEKLIKDNVSTNANGTTREQLATMIDVLAQKKGVYINNVNFPNVKASDHGIASLYIITLFDVGLDPNLIEKAYTNNVNVYKRWITYNVNTKQFEVSGGYEDLTPTTVTPPKAITTRKSPGYIDPLLTTKAVYPDWNIQ